MTPPANYESAMSLLTLAIGSIERHPPVTRHDQARVRLFATRLETAANVAARRLENV